MQLRKANYSIINYWPLAGTIVTEALALVFGSAARRHQCETVTNWPLALSRIFGGLGVVLAIVWLVKARNTYARIAAVLLILAAAVCTLWAQFTVGLCWHSFNF